MCIVGAEYQRLTSRRRLKFCSQELANDPIERFRNNFAIKVIHFHLDFVGRLKQLNLTGRRRHRPEQTHPLAQTIPADDNSV